MQRRYVALPGHHQHQIQNTNMKEITHDMVHDMVRLNHTHVLLMLILINI